MSYNYKKYLGGFLLLSILFLSGCSLFSTGRNRFGSGNPEFEDLKKSCNILKSQAIIRLYLGNGGATTAFWYSVTYQDQETDELQFFSSYSSPAINDIICETDTVSLKGEKDFDFNVVDIKTKFIKTPVLFYRDKLEDKSSFLPIKTSANKETQLIPETQKQSQETAGQSNPCVLDNYNAPLRFCEVENEYIKKYIEWQNIEVQMNQKYFFAISYGNFEAQRTYGKLLLKDKQTGKFYITNKSVWDATFTPDGNALIVSTIFDIEPEKKDQYFTEFAKLFHVSSKKIADFANTYVYESELENVSTLAKISLPARKIEFIGYLGGEEIAITKNKIIFTQFTENEDWYWCYNHVGIKEVDCSKMKIPVLEIDQNTYKTLKSYNLSQFGEIKSKKKIEAFDLYSHNDQKIREELLKLFDIPS